MIPLRYSNMAVAVTDAFLGDYSSMCTLYGIEGKPIFLTDNRSLEEPTEEERRQLWLGFISRELDVREWKPYDVRDKYDNPLFYDNSCKLFGKMSWDERTVFVTR